MTFSEAWLRDYQNKRAKLDAVPTPDTIRFTLSKPTVLLNVFLRMVWTARGKYHRSMCSEIASLVPYVPGREPFRHALVTVTRYSVREPDYDNLVGGLKPMIDALLVRSKVHPLGLGLIVDDAPEHLTLVAKSVHCKTHKQGRTEVVIERIDSPDNSAVVRQPQQRLSDI